MWGPKVLSNSLQEPSYVVVEYPIYKLLQEMGKLVNELFLVILNKLCQVLLIYMLKILSTGKPSHIQFNFRSSDSTAST